MNPRFLRALLLASILLLVSLGLTVRFEQQQREELARVTAFSNQDELWHSVALSREYLKLREIAALSRFNAAYYLQLRTRYDIFAGRVAAMQNGAFMHQLIDQRAYGEHMGVINRMITDTDARWARYPMTPEEVDHLIGSLDHIQGNLQTIHDLIQHGFADQLDENEKLVTRLGRTRIALAVFQSLLLLGFAGMALFELRRSLQREHLLGEARSAAQAANEAKSRFLANVSHEMRTPLTSVLGYAGQTLKDPSLSATSRHQLGLIRRSAEYLASLLGNVLDVSRIEANRVQLNSERLSLSSLADDLYGLFALQASEKGILLTIAPPPENAPQLQIDGGKLRQILINLIGNAVKFTLQGHVHVAFSLRDAPQGRLQLQTRVSDTGPGIAAGELTQLFSPFEQTASGRAAGGSGLGLAISREFARLMGGDVVCSASSSAGSVFDATVLADAAPDAGPVTTPILAAPQLHGLAVLVLEDQAINRELLAEILRGAHAVVTTVATLHDARQLLTHKAFDAVVLDYNLPDGNGLEFARYLRAQQWRGRLLMLSAALHPGTDALDAAGVDRWLAKPFDSAELIAALAGRAARNNMPAPISPSDLLDMDAAMLRLGCNASRYLAIATRGLNRIEELLRDYAADEAGNRSRLAHSARGVALQIGAMSLAAACGDLEFAPAAAKDAARLDNMDQLLAHTRQALATLTTETRKENA
jgi:signal transduction histidine kinase/DNA-binding response OmpR family regulator